MFMYNTRMIKSLKLAVMVLGLSSCAVNQVYNPIQTATTQSFELNAGALKRVKVGMKVEEVHGIMAEAITIGYTYQKSSAQGTPITLPNPYKTTEAKSATGNCTVEYYVTGVTIPDGVVSDNELMPLKFCNGVLVSKGWDALK